jgi:hypothetical protein
MPLTDQVQITLRSPYDERRQPERLEHQRAHGATAHAFWFGKLFTAPEFAPV